MTSCRFICVPCWTSIQDMTLRSRTIHLLRYYFSRACRRNVCFRSSSHRLAVKKQLIRESTQNGKYSSVLHNGHSGHQTEITDHTCSNRTEEKLENESSARLLPKDYTGSPKYSPTWTQVKGHQFQNIHFTGYFCLTVGSSIHYPKTFDNYVVHQNFVRQYCSDTYSDLDSDPEKIEETIKTSPELVKANETSGTSELVGNNRERDNIDTEFTGISDKLETHEQNELDEDSDISESDSGSDSDDSSIEETDFDLPDVYKLDDKSLQTNGTDQAVCNKTGQDIDNEISEVSKEQSESSEVTISKSPTAVGYIKNESSSSVDVPGPHRIREIYNLAPLVPKSKVLRTMVYLGASLAHVEKLRNAANILVKLDYKTEFEPVIFFLKDIGIPDNRIGFVITRNPFIFDDLLENLQVKVNYFHVKRFSREAMVEIITKYPHVLSMPVKHIDKKLGIYQKCFKLTGVEVRDLMRKAPKLIFLKEEILRDNLEMMTLEYQLTKPQLKQMILTSPNVFLVKKLNERMNYIMEDLRCDQTTVTTFCDVLRIPSFTLKERHLFLLEKGRAQYDPTKPNYVTLENLATTPERQFVKDIARSNLKEFSLFKKSL